MQRKVIGIRNSETKNQYGAYTYASPDLEAYTNCPTQYGKTPGEAAGKVLAWLIDHNADVDGIEICQH
jgi:hypothetical protein